MEYTPEIAALCASIGARLLDRTNPGWEQAVVPRRLKMDNSSTCVIGQLYPATAYPIGLQQAGVYDAAHDDLREESLGQDELLMEGDEKRFGFNLPDFDLNYEAIQMGYATLARAWKREIAKRKRKSRAVHA